VSATPKGPVPLWRWGIWWLALGTGITLFYVVLTPIWLGLRLAARLADLRKRGSRAPVKILQSSEGEQ
jgi:hypothetical protein